MSLVNCDYILIFKILRIFFLKSREFYIDVEFNNQRRYNQDYL